jgi:transcriptional regulator with PAS, ATPase and Fis domain
LILTRSTATLSSKHVRLLRVGDAWAIQDRGSRNGTWLNGHRIEYAELDDHDVFQVGRTFYLFRRYKSLDTQPEWPDIADVAPEELPTDFATLSPEIALENDSLRTVASSSLPVLILGNTGTGKELAARTVHEASGRSGKLCAVNCGAIPKGLVESVIFGHVKGAFSGAVSDQLGVIRQAQNGTLFLDEIGDLAIEAQASLLRVLQEGEVVPIGTSRPVCVDVRVVSATHQPLQSHIGGGQFRADLYARLAGHIHQLRPLESRLEDFGLLFGQLLRRVARDDATRVTLTTDAGWALLRHAWPLNVRELQQAIARAYVLANIGPLDVAHFPFVLHQQRQDQSSCGRSKAGVDVSLRRQLDELLREHNGNVAAVARALGKGPTQVQRWLKRVGLVADRYRPR